MPHSNNTPRYKYAFVDAQLYLTRNWMMLKDKPGYHDQKLLKSFIQSIIKLVREEVTADNVVLLWDKSPYYKTRNLSDYKGDRDYRGEESITEDMTEEEKAELKKKTEQFQSRQRVKYKLVSDSAKLGFPSIILSGFEADDFAYIVSRSKLVNESEEKSVLVSKDSDWVACVTPKVDFYRITKTREIYVYEDALDKYEGMDLYEYNSIYQSLYGSHNYLKNNRNPEIILDGILHVKDLIGEDNYSFTKDKELFLLQLESFRVEDNPEYNKADWLVNNIPLKAEYPDENAFNQYCIDNFLDLNYSYYKGYLKALNR